LLDQRIHDHEEVEQVRLSLARLLAQPSLTHRGHRRSRSKRRILCKCCSSTKPNGCE
jgi:hypothetical protein